MSKPPHNQRGKPPIQTAQAANVVHVRHEETWTGPLPSPDALAKFNSVIPNGADRVMRMAENEQAHRISTESAGLKATVAESRRGQYLGAGISLVAIIGAVYTAHIGAHWSVSVALVGLTILGIIRSIVRPRK